MSYEIVYDKLSVDMGNGLFMPVFLVGSNNSYTVSWKGRYRRDRNWYGQPGINNNYFQTKDEWRESCQAELKKADCDSKSFTNHKGLSIQGSSSSFKVYENLFVAATDKSVTFEKLVADYSVDFYIVKGDERTLCNDKAEFMALVKSFDKEHLPYVYLSASESVAKRVRAELYPIKKRKKIRKFVDVEYYYVIKLDDVTYYYGLSRNGVLYSPYQTGGKRYISKKEAQAKIKYIQRKRPGMKDLKIERIDEPASIIVNVLAQAS